MPIEVCIGHYCWGHGRLCPHFSNEGGFPVCDLNLGDLEYNDELGVTKPQKCKDLKDV